MRKSDTYCSNAPSKGDSRKLSFCVVLAAEWCILLGIIAFITTLVLLVPDSNDSNKHFATWCIGACEEDAITTSSPGAVLMGGGTDTDEAFEWHIRNANGGDFLVMRASGSDDYNQYIYDMSITIGTPLNSVRTIRFNDAQASHNDKVLQYVRDAEAIFFAGGDQSLYISYWKDTEVQSLIQQKLTNITVGGTSAGLAVLGEWVYTGEDGSVVSDEAMMDPYNNHMDFSSAFLRIPFLESVITDTHFVARDRMGRMLSFVARIYTDIATPTPVVVHSIGVDEHTALLLDVITGDAITVGVGTAYVCTANAAPSVCEEDTPLTYHGNHGYQFNVDIFADISCMRLNALDDDTYNFATMTGSGVVYSNNITAGYLSAFPYGPE